MIKIAHRGNFNGPRPELENSPEHILEALSLGFDVEIDVWVVNNEICFGHDSPTHRSISESLLIEIGHKAWFHCKNLEALYFFNSNLPQLNYFWHQDDDHTLTSQGYIWTYPGKEVTNKSVIVDLKPYRIDYNSYAICSDWGK